MKIKNNVLKEKLKNVYFIAGTNCGGKSTMAKHLSKEFNMIYYSADDHYWNHRQYSDIENQPAMNRPFTTWDEYFSRNAEKQANWLLDSELEEMDFIILDLIELAKDKNQKVVVDIHCMPEIFKQVSTYGRVIFLLADPELVYNEYFSRDDKSDMLKCIMKNTTNPEFSIENTRLVSKVIAQKEIDKAIESGFLCNFRDEETNFLERAEAVIKHFNI
ncbi:hypothetical protein RI065_00275 [Mycoplasmatota bacterium zrk1]